MDDVKLLTLTGLRGVPSSAKKRRKATKGSQLSVWTPIGPEAAEVEDAANQQLPDSRVIREEDDGNEQAHNATMSSLALKSIAKGGLPAVNAKTKTKFYGIMMRLNAGGSENEIGPGSPLPGSPQKKAKARGNKVESPRETTIKTISAGGKPLQNSTAVTSRPKSRPPSSESPPSAPAGGSRRRPASVASSSPTKASQQARGRSDGRAGGGGANNNNNINNSSMSGQGVIGIGRVRTAAGHRERENRGSSQDSYSSAPSLGAPRSRGRPVGNQEENSDDAAAESFSRTSRAALSRAHHSLTLQHAASNRDESLTRMQLMQEGDQIVSNLPLDYLYARPKLRHYAVARAVAIFYRMCMKKATEQCRRAVSVWKNPPVIVMNEMQVGFMVIAKRLEALLGRVLRVKFDQWARCYSVRFLAQRDAFRNSLASEIQRWYRLVRVLRREPYKRLLDAINVCLQRRRAIKYAMEFEVLRRRGQIKVLRTVLYRRRRHFAVRSIIRVKHWLDLYRKTTWRLIRMRAVRALQRWWRMILCRPEEDRAIIRFIVRIGGKTKVLPRVQALPPKYLRTGFLHSMNMLASMVQRAWLTSKGQLALFMIMAAKRAKAEYEKMLNDNATVIQHNWRGHLWIKLNKIAIIWNRARRIQRGYRAYQYRCWMHNRLQYRFQRYVRFLQAKVRRWITRRLLQYRFKARKAVLIFTRAKKTLCAKIIQRCYRDYKERERIRIELLMQLIAGLRAKADVVIKSISCIQRNWRQNKKLDRKGNGKNFPKHVRMIIEKIVRKQRLLFNTKAKIIQEQVRRFIPVQIRKRLKMLRKNANIIWRFGKAYLLKLAIWNRIEARRLREKIASNRMKRNFRRFLFRQKIYLRGRIRGVQRRHKLELHAHATYIQRWVRRKRIEYWVLPVRKAARINVTKRREVEVLRREALRLDHAARTLVRFFRPWPIWARFIIRLAKERRYYVERKAAKKMQKLARRVVAWARFDRVVAYRRRQVALSSRDPYFAHAANIIGHYWKRCKEKMSLDQRFTLRRLMIVEWKRLEENRLAAMEQKRIAEEDKRRTDENMAATIKASWKQGADAITGKNYFYNYVTGETRWEPPEDWKAPITDMWMRQVDEKGNVYYYNMKTMESQWLPPCVICGEMGEKYCADCTVAYCEKDFEIYHIGPQAESEEWADHKWSLTEYASDILKPGEVFCVECKKRCASVVCTTCWDNYCKVCFNFVHHTGQLRFHSAIPYQKARKGWTIRKATAAGDVDYYINGSTGETTFEKPEELMTPEELLYFTNFKSHQKAAEDHIETIKKLQFDLEAIAYERDLIVERAFKEGTNIGDIMARRTKKKPNRFAQETNNVNVVAEVAKKTKPGYKLFSSTFAEYRQSLLQPNPRKRGAEKSKFIESLLLESGSPVGSPKKNAT